MSDMEESKDEHSHCRNCFRLRCQSKDKLPHACPFMSCPLLCCASFHSCKAKEHEEICSNVIVPCVNSAFGCSRTMRRSERGRHLETCPASVVFCALGWRCYTEFSEERQEIVPLMARNHTESGTSSSRDADGLLENQPTEKFPAMPLTNSDTLLTKPVELSMSSEGMTSDEGISVSDIRNQRVVDCLQSTNKVDVFLTDGREQNAMKLLRDRDQSVADRTVSGESLHAYANVAEQKNMACNVVLGKIEIVSSPSGIASDRGDHIVIKSSDSVASFKSCCGSLPRNSVAALHDEAYNKFLKLNDDALLFHFHNIASDIRINVRRSPSRFDAFFRRSAAARPEHQKCYKCGLNYFPPSKYPPPSVQEVQSLNTFCCDQNLRRDEYPWHIKNTHAEIHQGLNGWIVVQCPLNCYGCHFSVRRLNPVCGTLVYNTCANSIGIRQDLLHSSYHFGTRNPDRLVNRKENVSPPENHSVNGLVTVVPKLHSVEAHQTVVSDVVIPADNTSAECGNMTPCTSSADAGEKFADGSKKQAYRSSQDENSSSYENIVSVLPLELLRYITRYLDSFSLYNLAMTCHCLRDVCKSVVKERGIVVQEWQKLHFESGSSWQVTYQRWFFSKAYTPVECWQFIDSPSLSDHLKVCPYNITAETRKEPFKLCPVPYERLTNRETSENVTENVSYPVIDTENANA